MTTAGVLASGLLPLRDRRRHSAGKGPGNNSLTADGVIIIYEIVAYITFTYVRMADMKKPLEDLESVFPHQLYRTGRLLRYFLQRRLKDDESRLTPEQYFIIYRLFLKDGQTQRELADRTLNDHPNITNLIDRLEEKGYVQRGDDETDRRSYVIRLSAKGRRNFERAIPMIKREIDKLLKGISREEIKTVQKVLSNLEANIAG